MLYDTKKIIKRKQNNLANKYQDALTAEKKLVEAKVVVEKVAVEKIAVEIAKAEEYYRTYYKNDWRDFENTLRQCNIKSLYHFTDTTNIASIKLNGGLYSWWSASERGIPVSKSGGNDLSKSLDKGYDLQDYVRLSFTRNHPMMYVAKKDGRIPNPIVLKISPEVIFWKETRFSDRNATANKSLHGKEFNDFKRIKFDIVTKESPFDIEEIDKPYYQAEIMVKTFIPINFILEGL